MGKEATLSPSVSETVKKGRLERLYEKYNELHWSHRLLLSLGLTLTAGVGFVLGGSAGLAIGGAAGIAKLMLGILAGVKVGQAAFSYTQGKLEKRGVQSKVLSHLAGYIAAGLVAALTGRALALMGTSGSALIATAEAATTSGVETVETLVAYLGQPENLFAVDYDRIWGEAQVLWMGHEHSAPLHVPEIISSLDSMKANGMTHIALEMFRADQQALIQQYMDGSITREKLFSDLNGRWSYGSKSLHGYMQLVDACKDKGIQIIGIDTPNHSGTHVQKSAFWASVIGTFARENPDAKILVVGGANHFGYSASDTSANEVMRDQYGVSSRVVKMYGSESTTQPKMSLFQKALRTLGLENTRVAAVLDRTAEPRVADFVVNLPRTPREYADADV
jgi:hypothetical protein